MEDDDVSRLAGDVGFVSEIALLCTEFFISYAMDVFGRKVITVTGLTVAAMSLIAQALPQNIVWLYVFRSLTQIGCIAALFTPYNVDYVKKESLGLLSAYYGIMAVLSSFLTTSVAIEIQKTYSV